MSKAFSEKIDKIFDVSFSSTFSVLSRFQALLSDGRVQKHYKKVLQKSRQKSKTDCFSIFFITILGVSR
jgi:hypothetical protein